MIAALLPGFRELRVPLSAGALWIGALWIASRQFAPDLEHQLWAEVTRASGWAGVTASLGALAVVAYVLGILVANLNPIRIITSWTLGRDARAKADVEARLRSELSLARSRGVDPLKVIALFPELDHRRGIRFSQSEMDELSISESEFQMRTGREMNKDEANANAWWFYLTVKQETLMERVLDRMTSSADHLMIQQKDLFDALDRKKAEGDFRLAVAIPVAVIVGLLGYGFTADLRPFAIPIGWAIGVGAFVGLSRTGYFLSTELRSTVTRYVASGILESPTLDAIRALK